MQWKYLQEKEDNFNFENLTNRGYFDQLFIEMQLCRKRCCALRFVWDRSFDDVLNRGNVVRSVYCYIIIVESLR